MKSRILSVVTIILIVCLVGIGLVACDKDDDHVYGEWQYDDEGHWQKCTVKGHDGITEKQPHTYVDGAKKTCSVCGKTVDYTDEENLRDFVAACDFAENYVGAYTLKAKIAEKCEDELTMTDIAETFDDKSKVYSCTKKSCTDNDGSSEERTTVLQPSKLDNTDIDCVKYFGKIRSVYNGVETESSEAEYFSPNKIDDFLKYSPSRAVETLYRTGCKTLDDIKNVFVENFAYIEDLIFDEFYIARNADGSLSLHIQYRFDEINNKSAGYCLKTVFSAETVVQGGKVVKASSSETEETYVDNKLSNTTVTEEVATYEYEFDEDLFASVDTTTEVVTNAYYCSYNVYLNGYNDDSVYSGYDLAGKKFTLDEIAAETFGRSFWTNVKQTDVECAFYEDADKTKPASAEYILDQPEINLYLTVTPRSGKAIVVCVFCDVENRISLKTAYLVDVGERFYPRGLYKNKPILYVNGQPVGEYTSFVCSESKFYEVVYDGDRRIDTEQTHDKAVAEWSFDGNGHWHECDDCGLLQLQWGVHAFADVDGNSVCSVCGYPEGGTGKEHYAAWKKALDAFLAAQNNKLITYTITDLQTYDGDATQTATKQSRDGDRYFIDKHFYKLVNGDWQSVSSELTACKVDADSGRLAVLNKSTKSGTATAKGVIKRSGYAVDELENNVFFYTGFDVILSVDAETVEAFGQAVMQAMAQFDASSSPDREKVVTLSSDVMFIVGNDGSVTMRFVERGEYVSGHNKKTGYVKNVFESTYDITALNGKLTSFVCDNAETETYENKDENKSSTWQYNVKVDYSFDNETYSEIDFDAVDFVDEEA